MLGDSPEVHQRSLAALRMTQGFCHPGRSEGSLAVNWLFKCSRGVPKHRPCAYGSGSGPYCPLASMSVPDHMRSKMLTAAACETMFGWQRSSMRYGTKRMLTSVVPRQ